MTNVLLQANWIHRSDTERWLRRNSKGLVLNVCCGKSKHGEIRMDIDSNTNYNVKGDLFNLPFRKLCFDTVICDPPFSYYNRRKWIYQLSDLAKSKLFLSTCNSVVNIKKALWKRSLYYSVMGLFLRMYWVFERRIGRIDSLS